MATKMLNQQSVESA